ncbi:MAG: Zn-dependent hydrolase [Longimicrobiales bacterium]
MNRRRFSRLSAAGILGVTLPLDAVSRAVGDQEIRVDGTRLNRRMAELARFGANDAGGIDRVAFSQADLDARAWVRSLWEEAGLTTSVDVAGNLWGRRPGSDPSRPPLILGSHIDSVPGGGNYDGQVGSMGATEVAATLHDQGRTTRHPLEFVIFPNEEGGKTGSRALAGQVEAMELELETASGFTIGEGLRRLGGDPDRLSDVVRAPGSATAFLELHVEQGGVLDADGIDIGVVEGIVGIMRWTVTVDGTTNHAGTTPMDRRSDALVAAARFVDAVHRTALDMPGRQVATVGRIAVEPGAPNVIPGRATLSLEVRDLTMEGIERVYDAVRARADAIGRDTGTSFTFERFYTSGAAPTHPHIRNVVEASAEALGLSHRRMPSGAGHDAQSIAVFAPVGMIFVPSRQGISHAPDEFTEPGDVTNGTDTLLRTLLALDASPPA